MKTSLWLAWTLVCFSFFDRAYAENVFRARLISDPTTLDWNLAHTDVETPVMMNIMEGLFEFDSKMKVTPLLAQSWSVSPDQKTYTFKIRTDVKWSDGKPLTAHDFEYSWQRLLAPLTAASYAYMLFDIEGAKEFNSRQLTDFSKVGIKALSDSTLQVKLRRPLAYFLQLLTFWVTFPMRKDVVEKFGPSWAQPGKMIVLGPFVPTTYQPQNQLALKRNPLYHGKKPDSESIVFRMINEDSTALNLFKADQLDYVRPVNFLEVAGLKNTPMFHVSPYYRTCFLSINAAKYPLNLPKVRQALAMAIDRSKISSALHRDVAMADSLMPEALFPEGKNSALSFNADAAKKLLTEALGDPKSFPRLDFFTFTSDENALLAQFIQDQLKRNLGVNINIQMPEFTMYRQQLRLQTGHMYFRCWSADYADPDTFFATFLSQSGNSFTSWRNAKYDELVTSAAVTPNGVERTRIYKEALDIMLRNEAPVVPLYFDSLTYLLNPKIKGFVINPLNYVFFRNLVFPK